MQKTKRQRARASRRTGLTGLAANWSYRALIFLRCGDCLIVCARPTPSTWSLCSSRSAAARVARLLLWPARRARVCAGASCSRCSSAC
jgi:hypothetical protein